MYRPWFLKLEDLREMVRAAIKTEAEARVARLRRDGREETNRALAAMPTAVRAARQAQPAFVRRSDAAA